MEPEWNISLDQHDANMMGLNNLKQEIKYLNNKIKIKSFIEDIGMEDILKYMIESIDVLDIDSDDDIWKFKVLDSLKDAYGHYLNGHNVNAQN